MGLITTHHRFFCSAQVQVVGCDDGMKLPLILVQMPISFDRSISCTVVLDRDTAYRGICY